MRPVPSWLPPANSRKWHSRWVWDNLGYLRVRTLSNPSWPRDLRWLLGILRRYRPTEPGDRRDQFDRAVQKATTYQSAKHTDEQIWHDFLDAFDAFLWTIQQDHLAPVDPPGVSGPRRTPAQVRIGVKDDRSLRTSDGVLGFLPRRARCDLWPAAGRVGGATIYCPVG